MIFLFSSIKKKPNVRIFAHSQGMTNTGKVLKKLYKYIEVQSTEMRTSLLRLQKSYLECCCQATYLLTLLAIRMGRVF